jgi:CBS domain-containing protein
MTNRVVSLRSDETVATAVHRMREYGFGALPVVSPAGRLIGVVSLLDVLRYREEHEEQGLDADERVPVEDLMNPDVVSMAATANVASVARRLAESGQLRILPVVDGGRLVGIVSRSDVLRGTAATPRQSGLDRLLTGHDDAEDEDGALLALARRQRAGPPPPPATPVRQVMTTEVTAVTATELVSVAGALMLRERHPSLPVVETDATLVGVISEADILADPFAGRQAHLTVGSVMTRGAISIDVGVTVGQARALVADRGLRILPVVERGRLVGVLSRSDLI